jgi:integrase
MSFTITERGPNNFAIRVRPGRHREPFYFRVHGSRAEAETAAAKWVKQIGLRPLDPNTTLGTWLTHILANAHDLAPRSLATYRTHLAWINPAHPGRWSLGAMRLRDITDADAGAYLAWLTDGCGCDKAYLCHCVGGFRAAHRPRTVRDSIVLVRAALERAVKHGMLPANPWEHVKLPRAKRRPPATPGRADFAKLLDCPQPRVRLLLLLAAYTGARRSELLGLTWENIDLRGGCLTIGASLDHTRGKEPVLKEPKTDSGRRTIALPAAALAELRIARLWANSAAVNAGRRIETVPVFANEDGSWWTPEAASQAAHRALAELGLPGSLHTLRHAHATLLLGGEGGVSAHVVSRRLGHATVATTLSLYAHAIPADDSSAADAIDRLFAPGSTAAGRR